MYFIELMLTKNCNKSCYYCTTKKQESSEVDIDYLKWVLKQFDFDVGVDITGGEIGLVKNIDDIYKEVKDCKRVKYIIALSNGMLRRRNPDWIRDIEYWEHLIYDIKGKEVIKHYRDLDLKQDWIKYIVIMTEVTTKSLLANWEYYESKGFFKPNFLHKIMNHKSNTRIEKYTDDLTKFYSRLNDHYHQKMLLHYKVRTYLKREKNLCQRWSPNAFIDFQTKELGHCAVNVKESNRVPFNKENLLRLMDGEFSENNYCEKCYSFDYGRNRTKFNNRSYRR